MVDSGCTDFMCNQLSSFQLPLNNVETSVRLGDETVIKVHQAGNVFVLGEWFRALYVPTFCLCLLSVPQLDSNGFSCKFAAKRVLFSKKGVFRGVAVMDAALRLYFYDGINTGQPVVSAMMATTRSKNKMLWKKSVLVAGLFLLRNRRMRQGMQDADSSDSESEEGVPEDAEVNLTAKRMEPLKSALFSDTTGTHILGKRRQRVAASFYQWHCRFGHVNGIALSKLSVFDSVTADDRNTLFHCNSCAKAGAIQRTGKNITVPRSMVLYERVHADLCGPFVPSKSGSCYYIAFVEEASRYGEVAMLKKKSEVIKAWVEFRTRRGKQGFTILSLRSDNGGEFKALVADLKNNGITWERSPPYTQHANGISEKYIRSLNTKPRALMLSAGVPDWCWADAISVANYLHCLVPQQSLGWTSPQQILDGTAMSTAHLRVFGCLAYRWLHPAQQKSGKWVAHASPGMFVGYGLSKSIYRLYDFTTLQYHEASSLSFREDTFAWPLLGHQKIGDVESLFQQDIELSDDDDYVPTTADDQAAGMRPNILASRMGLLSDPKSYSRMGLQFEKENAYKVAAK